MIATLPSASNQRRRTVLTRQHPECKQTELARERAAGQPRASTAEHTHRLSSTHMSMRIVYAPETVPLSTLSSNSDATGSRASANRSRRKGRPATKQAAAKGSCNPSPRHAARGRARAGCPNGPARSGKRRANPLAGWRHRVRYYRHWCPFSWLFLALLGSRLAEKFCAATWKPASRCTALSNSST